MDDKSTLVLASSARAYLWFAGVLTRTAARSTCARNPEGIDDLIEVLGLPADLPTFPPDPEVRDYPPFVEIVRAGLALHVLPREARTADRDELIWATSCLATFELTRRRRRYS